MVAFGEATHLKNPITHNFISTDYVGLGTGSFEFGLLCLDQCVMHSVSTNFHLELIEPSAKEVEGQPFS